jgi:FAD/FMN-containing dehydrogenase
MNDIAPMPAERLFPPFIDPVDGVLCLPSTAGAAEIRAQAGAHGLRFPLILDDGATLRDQIHASTFAPASCRFGPYCDNILGMNWRLPDGRIARIGERVVKTTTGYDWLRFLLHSGGRFGEPLDYVLRLRPDCGGTIVARLDGATDRLRAGVSALLHSGWMHWWDAVDFICDDGTSFARVTVHCPPAEIDILSDQLRSVATSNGLQPDLLHETMPPADGLPDLVIKTAPDRVMKLAGELAGNGNRCTALCYNGVVHVYRADPSRIPRMIQPILAELHAIGGDWHSRHLPPPAPSPDEAAWINTLREAVDAR